MAMMYIKSRGKHCFPYESNEQETSNDTRLEKISSYNEPMNKNNAIHRILHGKAVSMNGSQKISKCGSVSYWFGHCDVRSFALS